MCDSYLVHGKLSQHEQNSILYMISAQTARTGKKSKNNGEYKLNIIGSVKELTHISRLKVRRVHGVHLSSVSCCYMCELKQK